MPDKESKCRIALPPVPYGRWDFRHALWGTENVPCTRGKLIGVGLVVDSARRNLRESTMPAPASERVLSAWGDFDSVVYRRGNAESPAIVVELTPEQKQILLEFNALLGWHETAYGLVRPGKRLARGIVGGSMLGAEYFHRPDPDLSLPTLENFMQHRSRKLFGDRDLMLGKARDIRRIIAPELQ